MSRLNLNPPERPEERRERSDRSDEGLSGGRAVSPEVTEKAKRRQFTSEYKMKILEELDRCTIPGQIGLLLRREGLYSGILSGWRKWRNQMEGRTPVTKTSNTKALHNEIARLKRNNDRLTLKLQKAEGIIELQKKISQMFDLEDRSAKKDDC